MAYIGNVVNGIIKIADKELTQIKQRYGEVKPPYKICNICNSNTENLLDFVNILYEELIKSKIF